MAPQPSVKQVALALAFAKWYQGPTLRARTTHEVALIRDHDYESLQFRANPVKQWARQRER